MRLDKWDLLQAPVTLDGKDAVILGSHFDYATVASLDGTIRGDWSWAEVKRIVVSGGKFKAEVPRHSQK